MPEQLVELAVSRIGGIPGANAYHTSVLVNGFEFSFSASAGISKCRGALSHAVFNVAPRVYELGHSQRTGNQLVDILGPYFTAGSYDLLRKNCNSFTDVALFFLLGRRLRAEYRSLEKFGASMPGLVQTVSGGRYSANPEALDFDVDVLVQGLEASKLAIRCNSRPEQTKKKNEDNDHANTTCTTNLLGGASDAIWDVWQKLWDGSVSPTELCGSKELRRAKMLQEDEKLAKQLQAEEEDLHRDKRQRRRPQDDEALARKLQAEEHALYRATREQSPPAATRSVSVSDRHRRPMAAAGGGSGYGGG